MISDNFAYLGYSVGWSAVRRMSEKRAYAMFGRGADQVWRRHGSSVKQYEKNLARVLPDADAQQLRLASRDGLHSYARYWCDAFRMPDWPMEKIVNLPVEGVEHIDSAVAAGEKVFFVVPHAGNYDWGAAFLAQRYGSCTTVAETLKPEKLFKKFVAFRTELGMEIIGTKTPNIIETLVQRVDSGVLCGVVADRDLSRHGVPVQFFGEPTTFPRGPAVVARRTGARILPVSFYYTPHSAAATILPPIEPVVTDDEDHDVKTNTQLIADQLQVGISRHPTDWHMLQPLWRADLDPNRGPRARET